MKTTAFDAAKFIRTPEDVIDTLNDALQSGEPAYVAAVLGYVARSEGMSRIAAETGVNRQALYTALSEDGNPTLGTLLKVFDALGIRLRCEKEAARAA
jgi:probable addiction module antidote protein